MTDYNDGRWHGWNGGECHVHPESVVQWVNTAGTVGKMKAGALLWNNDQHPVCAFRVVKAHRDPRTFWAVGRHLHDTLADAEEFCDKLEASHPGMGYGDKGRIVKLVEVME